MSNLAEKLQQLLRLATLLPHEQEDKSRENEARTAAWMLLREVQKHGVTIHFKLPKAPEPPRRPVSQRKYGAVDFDFDEFAIWMNNAVRETQKRREPGSGVGPFYRTAPPFKPQPKPSYGRVAVVRTICTHGGTRCESCGESIDSAETVYSDQDGKHFTHERCGPEALL